MKNLFRRYSFYQLIHLVFDLLRTKLIFKKARIIRFPFDVRGRRFMSIEKGFTTGVGCRLEAYPDNKDKVLFIDENVQINDYVHITSMQRVEIKKNVLIASKVYISDCSHGSYIGDFNDSNPLSIPKDRPLISKPVIIEENVWIGEFVSILPGVTIGKGTVVGANSVVSKSLPSYVVAVGSPAKPIKKFNFDTQRWVRV